MIYITDKTRHLNLNYDLQLDLSVEMFLSDKNLELRKKPRQTVIFVEFYGNFN